jgi:hypothetical protein
MYSDKILASEAVPENRIWPLFEDPKLSKVTRKRRNVERPVEYQVILYLIKVRKLAFRWNATILRADVSSCLRFTSAHGESLGDLFQTYLVSLIHAGKRAYLCWTWEHPSRFFCASGIDFYCSGKAKLHGSGELVEMSLTVLPRIQLGTFKLRVRNRNKLNTNELQDLLGLPGDIQRS